jgi:hypothetical protein
MGCMTTPTASLPFLQQFRQKLLGLFPRRADALFELIDALLLTLDPRSPVELSLSPAFRRRYGMVYDALQERQVALEDTRRVERLREQTPRHASTAVQKKIARGIDNQAHRATVAPQYRLTHRCGQRLL